MSCGPFDVRDYALGELSVPERGQVESHAATCANCATELERLRVTQAMLLSVPDEEPPQRIGFISDKVFEPSAARRFWNGFWQSGARLGFASAAMLSTALVIFALHRPVEKATPAPMATIASHEAAHDYTLEIRQAVADAVQQTESRDAKRAASLLAAAEQKHELEHKELLLAVQDTVSVMQKRMNRMTLASNDLSHDLGAPR